MGELNISKTNDVSTYFLDRLIFFFLVSNSRAMASNLCRPSLLKNARQVSKSMSVASFSSTKCCSACSTCSGCSCCSSFGQPTLFKNALQASKPMSVASFHSTKMVANDQMTHTGQTWSEDDKRNLRFMDRTKQTNTRWAADLIAEVPIIKVKTRIVACTGGDNPALGHPKVYINLDTHEPVCCIYCGLRYQLDFEAH